MIAFLDWIDRASSTSVAIVLLLALLALDALRIIVRGFRR